MTRQNPLTLATPVKNSGIDNLNALLITLRADLEKCENRQLQDIGTIHYLRLVVLEPKDADGNIFPNMPTRLIFSTDYDGDEEVHIKDLVTSMLTAKATRARRLRPIAKSPTLKNGV
jgi:hypothetical protein